MAVKKTELYSSLWASCDQLRGGMDASEYKDYILILLFMKYVTDKFIGQSYADIKVFDKVHDPEEDEEKRTGCSFLDFIALKGSKNIGEGMDKVIARLAQVNPVLKGVIDNAHFNNEAKMGKDKEMVDKLSKLIAIFQRPELDFSGNHAGGDDIIGDAYEYLMRNFATESGKSKGQFYTPAEVSRILAKVIGIDKRTDLIEVYDPACGSGSLLIRALDETQTENIAGYGQEKEVTTAGLAKMNAVLHNKASISIRSANTFANPQFKHEKDDSVLKRFDYIVANPPFSTKNWTDGLEEYGRFDGYGDRPPESNGDYAWLLHILKSLKNNGKAAVILPHGVLFRGNSEATIRKSIVDKGFVKGIISLPANLFYGTGIPACIIILDKEGAENRQGIFMIDASKGYTKDGNKNRLREQDIYRIVTTFNTQNETNPKYARFVPNLEIKEKNDYNLNISRYIDSSEPEDLQNIEAHIHGGIPAVDIDSLERYWQVFPTLKNTLVSVCKENFYQLNSDKDNIRQVTYADKEFSLYGEKIDEAFIVWKEFATPYLTSISTDTDVKALIANLSEKLTQVFESITLLDKYDVYQVLLSYWNEILNDDVLMIATDEKGYALARETEKIMGKITSGKKKGEEKEIGWDGKLIPKHIIINVFFNKEKNAIEEVQAMADETQSRLEELLENANESSTLAEISENGKVKFKDINNKIDEILSYVVDDEIMALTKMLELLPTIKSKKQYTEYIKQNPLCAKAYSDKGAVTKASIVERINTVRSNLGVSERYSEDYTELNYAKRLITDIDNYSKLVKEMEAELDFKCLNQYEKLSEDEIMDLLVNRKWFYSIGNGIEELYSAISHHLANRITELAERYENTLPELTSKVVDYEAKVKAHLERMGFVW